MAGHGHAAWLRGDEPRPEGTGGTGARVREPVHVCLQAGEVEMAEMVRAAVMEGPGRLEGREVPPPWPGPGAVLLKMQYSRGCGTAKHTYRGETKQDARNPPER